MPMSIPVFMPPVVMMILILIDIHRFPIHINGFRLFFIRGGHRYAGHTAQAGTDHGTFPAPNGRTDRSPGSAANRTSQYRLAIHIAGHYRGRKRGNHAKRQNSHSHHHIFSLSEKFQEIAKGTMLKAALNRQQQYHLIIAFAILTKEIIPKPLPNHDIPQHP